MSRAPFPTDEAFKRAADQLHCQPAVIRAVAKVESGPYGAFLPSMEPVILYERHVFRRLTGAKFDGSRVLIEGTEYELSAPNYGGYGPEHIQHEKLAAAVNLDRTAALSACSWGLFQIMGENYRAAGFKLLQEFVNAMYRSVDEHLAALVSFVKSDHRLLSAVQMRDWDTFKRVYNGPAENGYEKKLADAYRGFADVRAQA